MIFPIFNLFYKKEINKIHSLSMKIIAFLKPHNKYPQIFNIIECQAALLLLENLPVKAEFFQLWLQQPSRVFHNVS